MPYLYPESGHDYDFGFDYEEDEHVDSEIAALVLMVANDVRDNLLPKLQVFRDFTYGFVLKEHSKDDRLAIYIDGTQSHPYVALCIENIFDARMEYGVDLDVAIETSIVHELGHAIQNAYGIPTQGKKAEHDAEELAHVWHYERKVAPYFLRILHKESP